MISQVSSKIGELNAQLCIDINRKSPMYDLYISEEGTGLMSAPFLGKTLDFGSDT